MTQYRLNIMAVSDPGFIVFGKGFVTVSQQNVKNRPLLLNIGGSELLHDVYLLAVCPRSSLRFSVRRCVWYHRLPTSLFVISSRCTALDERADLGVSSPDGCWNIHLWYCDKT